MADQDDRDRPSLELPALSLRRRRRTAAEPEAAPTAAPTVSVEPEPEPGPPTPSVDGASVADGADPAPPRRALPRPSARVAAMVTGAVVGLLAVGITWLLLRLCGLVTGTSSCGNPGLLLLLAAVLALGLVGAALLRALGVEAPGSTSALGMGLLTVVAILFFGDALFSRWMTLVLPVVSLATYSLAHLVTTTATSATSATSDP